MAVKLSALRTARALLPRNVIFLLLVLIYVKRPSKPQDLARPENRKAALSGLEPATFRRVRIMLLL
jgi:hypothetical protein